MARAARPEAFSISGGVAALILFDGFYFMVLRARVDCPCSVILGPLLLGVVVVNGFRIPVRITESLLQREKQTGTNPLHRQRFRCCYDDERMTREIRTCILSLYGLEKKIKLKDSTFDIGTCKLAAFHLSSR